MEPACRQAGRGLRLKVAPSRLATPMARRPAPTQTRRAPLTQARRPSPTQARRPSLAAAKGPTPAGDTCSLAPPSRRRCCWRRSRSTSPPPGCPTRRSRTWSERRSASRACCRSRGRRARGLARRAGSAPRRLSCWCWSRWGCRRRTTSSASSSRRVGGASGCGTWPRRRWRGPTPRRERARGCLARFGRCWSGRPPPPPDSA